MKTNRTVIVQCRLSSTRLQGKALKILGDKTVFEWVLASMKKVRADSYYVATDEDSYEKLAPLCKKAGFHCFKGSLEDVLKRFADLLDTIKTKTVIRATADNPFLFYEAAEESVELFEEKNKGKSHCDYLTYKGLPHGSGVEIFSADSIKKAAKETDNPYDHEHVGPALYNHTDKYICEFVEAPRRFRHPELRTTIDTYSDYIHAISIVKYVGLKSEPYTTEQIIEACKSNCVKYPVVLVPSVVKGHGTGHLRRCLGAAIKNNFFVYIPQDKTLSETDKIVEEYLEKGLDSNQIITSLPDKTFPPVIITDTFELTQKQLKEFSENKSLISIDESSSYSDYCDYLLDIIPSYNCLRKANRFDTSFITKPAKVKQEKCNSVKNILICLGGEDPAGFTIPASKAFIKSFPQSKITAIVSGNENSYEKCFIESEKKNIEIVKPIPNLRDNLYKYDLVVTHYGLTAFESVYAGCGVILLPTTKLHKKLAEKYDFAFIGDEKITEDAVKKAFNSENLYPKLNIKGDSLSLGDFLKDISKGTRIECPVCGKRASKLSPVVARNEKRTYRRCAECGMIYLSYSIDEEKKYQKSYFFEDYKKQYGKTYKEDFQSIKKQGLRRIGIIKSIEKDLKDKTILDIGCAYGPFLSAALDSKMIPFGTDISSEAIDYVQSELKIPAACSAYPDINVAEEFGIAQFDVLTMWYVIEHFKDLDSVLRKTSSIVRKNGIFAFSTPSGEGVSAKSDKDNFFEISPSDHYTVWEPSRCGSILKKYGFKIEKIVSTGHHPERFPSIKKSGAKPGSLQWKIIENISHINKLGDTVEIYCKRVGK